MKGVLQMRITNNMLVNDMMRNLNSNYSKMDRIQQQLSTGKKFQLPSDDPIGVSKSLKYHTDVAMIEQHKRNLSDARSWLQVTEDAVAEMGDIFQRVRELTVQAANGTNTNEDLVQISAEVKQLKEHLIKVGNTSYAGRYIFSGFKTDLPLLDDDGNYKLTNYKEVATLGGPGTNKALDHDELINYNVGVSDNVNINSIGIMIFGKLDDGGDMDNPHFKDSTVDGYKEDDVAGEAVPTDADKTYLTALFDVINNALNVDDKATLNQSITRLDKSLENLLSVRADIGAKTSRLELTENRLDSQHTSLTKLLSENEDVNMAEVIMELKNNENVYRASLSIGARVIQPTLVDFLR